MKATQNVEFGAIWEVRVTQGTTNVQCHHLRAHTTSYFTLIETVSIMYHFRIRDGPSH